MKYAWRNVTRNIRVTLSAIAAVAALTFFLSVFTNSIQSNREQLARIYEVTTVTARITGFRSSPTARLDQERYQAILNSGFIKSSAAMIQEKAGGQDAIRAINSLTLDPDLEGWAPYMTWLEGYGPEVFSGSEAVCVAPKLLGLPLGKTVSLPLGGPKSSLIFEATVVGLYGPEYGSSQGLVYYCPLAVLETLMAQAEKSVIYNQMEMELCNLSRLNDFKARMKELELDKGSAQLVINDALLQQVTSQFRQHIRLLNMLLPILLALVAGIGFGLSFLLLRGRKREAAVMRSLGARRGQVFGILLAETALQALCGTVLGGLAAFAALGKTAFHPGYLALVLGCFLLGGAAAVWKMAKANVFTVMTAD